MSETKQYTQRSNVLPMVLHGATPFPIIPPPVQAPSVSTSAPRKLHINFCPFQLQCKSLTDIDCWVSCRLTTGLSLPVGTAAFALQVNGSKSSENPLSWISWVWKTKLLALASLPCNKITGETQAVGSWNIKVALFKCDVYVYDILRLY